MIHGHNGTDWKYSNIKHSKSCNFNIASGISRNNKKAISGSLSVDLWTMYIFSSFNAKNIFRPVSCLKHLQYWTKSCRQIHSIKQNRLFYGMFYSWMLNWMFCIYRRISKFGFRVAGWVLAIKSKHFRDFLKISSF